MIEWEREDLERMRERREQTANQETCRPRRLSQRVFAWVLAVIVLVAFLGMCYWMIRHGI